MNRMTTTVRNPYPKAEPRHWNAWKVGHRDAAAGLKHDPLGRGFSDIGLAMAYTKGYKA
jgi:hypothetical protein